MYFERRLVHTGMNLFIMGRWMAFIINLYLIQYLFLTRLSSVGFTA